MGVPQSDAERTPRRTCGAGVDREAFVEAVERSLPSLLGTAWRIVHNGPDAEDLVAETVARAWAKRSSFRGEAGFSTWLHAILYRAVADRYRSAGRRRRHEANFLRGRSAAANHGEAAAPAWTVAIATEEVQRAVGWLRTLPERQRLVLVLHVWERLELEEVARLLGMRYATAKSHLHHARAAMRSREAASRERPSEERS